METKINKRKTQVEVGFRIRAVRRRRFNISDSGSVGHRAERPLPARLAYLQLNSLFSEYVTVAARRGDTQLIASTCINHFRVNTPTELSARNKRGNGNQSGCAGAAATRSHGLSSPLTKTRCGYILPIVYQIVIDLCSRTKRCVASVFGIRIGRMLVSECNRSCRAASIAHVVTVTVCYCYLKYENELFCVTESSHNATTRVTLST